MTSEQIIIEFIKDFSGLDNVNTDSDLFGEVNITGDDFHDLMEKYSEKFNVDMRNYRWYFHTDEEGQNSGSLLFKSPHKLQDRIPVTPKLLADFANKGHWNISYPDHIEPPRRKDLLVNLIVLLTFIGILVYLTARHWLTGQP